MEGTGDLVTGETILRDFGRVVAVCYNHGKERVMFTPPDLPLPFNL